MTQSTYIPITIDITIMFQIFDEHYNTLACEYDLTNVFEYISEHDLQVYRSDITHNSDIPLIFRIYTTTKD